MLELLPKLTKNALPPPVENRRVPNMCQPVRSAKTTGPAPTLSLRIPGPLDWSGTPGSNRRPSPWQGDALPAELVPRDGSGLAPGIPCVKSVEGADVVHRGGDSRD